MMNVDTSLRQCPACRRRFDDITIPAQTLSQVERREFGTCFYCGVFLVEEDITLRVMTYTEFDLLDEGVRSELVRRRVAILDHWRKQPLEAHPKPQCSSARSDFACDRIRAGYLSLRGR